MRVPVRGGGDSSLVHLVGGSFGLSLSNNKHSGWWLTMNRLC